MAWENPLTQRRGEGLLPDPEERRDGGGTSLPALSRGEGERHHSDPPEEREKGTSPRPLQRRGEYESDQRALGR